MVDFDYEIQIWILWISCLPFDREIRKRICKTIVVNSGLLFANDACACKTAVIQILFQFGFPPQKKEKKGNERTDISTLKSVFRFRVRLQIRNPDFEI